MSNHKNHTAMLRAKNSALRILRSRYTKDFARLSAEHKAQGIKWYDYSAMRTIRKEHEAEYQRIYAVEAEKVGITSWYVRRNNKIQKMREMLNEAEQDLTSPLAIRLYWSDISINGK